MRVFRIETIDDGKGPYMNFDIDASSWQLQDHNSLPTPLQDDIEGFRDYHSCGFESLDKLYQWFILEEINNLLSLGFVIAEYEVDDCHVIKGNMQVAFNKNEAVLIRDIIAA